MFASIELFLQNVLWVRYNFKMIIWEDGVRLNALMNEVRSNTRSSFYKDRFKLEPVQSVETIVDLPLLERKDLSQVHPSERCYVDEGLVDFVAYTSGTTGGEPLLTYFAEVENYYIDPSWGLDVSKLLVVFPPLNKNFGGTFIQQCRQAPRPVTPVFGELSNLASSAYLAASVGCQGVYATPSIALALAPYIKQYYTLEAITFLAISGETIGETKLSALQALYPNAHIANLYASSEIGQFIMGPTKQMMYDNVSGFRLLPEAVIAAELIDNELVVTYGLNKAFPLIRYKTGDYFEVSEFLSKKYGDGIPVLTWSGKGGVDVIRIYGLEIRTGSVDDFFEHLQQDIVEYQLHVLAGTKPGALIFNLECVVDKEATYALELIRDRFLSFFKIDNLRTVGEVLTTDLIESVTVVSVTEVSHVGNKRRVLVNHVI